MKHITFYLDFISPYAYLAFQKLPEALIGHSYSVTYKPVLFGALLKHHGQLGPAEVAGKREWIYRQVMWLAHHQGVRLEMPAAHPFNPLALLRLAMACGSQGQPNRYVCDTLFCHVWQGGLDAVDPLRLQSLTAQLSPTRVPEGDDVKVRLKANTDEAIARGVFGVPTFEVDGKLFWGLDALPMLADYLRHDSWFDAGQWDSAEHVSVGVRR
jgi:2-hydroxychromene-2-carboxylate isomerase